MQMVSFEMPNPIFKGKLEKYKFVSLADIA